MQYLPLFCRSSEDAVYSVDDGELNLLDFEVVMYVLQKNDGQLNDLSQVKDTQAAGLRSSPLTTHKTMSDLPLSSS